MILISLYTVDDFLDCFHSLYIAELITWISRIVAECDIFLACDKILLRISSDNYLNRLHSLYYVENIKGMSVVASKVFSALIYPGQPDAVQLLRCLSECTISLHIAQGGQRMLFPDN